MASAAACPPPPPAFATASAGLRASPCPRAFHANRPGVCQSSARARLRSVATVTPKSVAISSHLTPSTARASASRHWSGVRRRAVLGGRKNLSATGMTTVPLSDRIKALRSSLATLDRAQTARVDIGAEAARLNAACAAFRKSYAKG